MTSEVIVTVVLVSVAAFIFYKNVRKKTSGDLVFYGKGGVPNHMGIYVGNGMYIHAPRTSHLLGGEYFNMKSLNLVVKGVMLSRVNLKECLYYIKIMYKIAIVKRIYWRAYFYRLFFSDKER